MLAIDIASGFSEAGGNVVDSVIMGEIERQRAAMQWEYQSMEVIEGLLCISDLKLGKMKSNTSDVTRQFSTNPLDIS